MRIPADSPDLRLHGPLENPRSDAKRRGSDGNDASLRHPPALRLTAAAGIRSRSPKPPIRGAGNSRSLESGNPIMFETRPHDVRELRKPAEIPAPLSIQTRIRLFRQIQFVRHQRRNRTIARLKIPQPEPRPTRSAIRRKGELAPGRFPRASRFGDLASGTRVRVRFRILRTIPGRNRGSFNATIRRRTDSAMSLRWTTIRAGEMAPRTRPRRR